MAHTTNLGLLQPDQGDLDGTWGTSINNSITALVEKAVAGRETINSWSGNAATLVMTDGSVSTARNMMLKLEDGTGGTALGGAGTLNVPTKTKLYLVRETNNKINKETLKARVDSLIKAFFLPANNELGQHLQLINLSHDILSLEGIKRIFTKNTNGTIFQGISFLSFNPMYPESDIELVNQDNTLPFFKFPYLYSPLTIADRIEVIDE